MGTELRKEEMNRASTRYIRQADTPDGGSLQSTNNMCEAFRQHFQNGFINETSPCEQEFHSYLADFPLLSSTEAAGCEDEVHVALKRVGSDKSPGFDGLSYELYMFLSRQWCSTTGSTRDSFPIRFPGM